ncbi:MAG: ParA family protein [Cetobacterium sp.]|nr:ParA family protein [Cetobacterium sp.]
MSTRIISIINFKGGVGKTTTVHSLGAGLTLKNKKVLLIDLDPQSSLTFLTFANTPDKSIKNIMVDNENINNVIVETPYYDIIPSDLYLYLFDKFLASKFAAEKTLARALKKLNKKYDYILIDCPPRLNTFTTNALVCSTDILIPCETELLALDGLELLIQTLEQLLGELNAHIKEILVLPTKVDNRKKLSKEILEYLNEHFKTTKTNIKICSKLNHLGLEKVSIFDLDPNCSGSKAYEKLADEVIKWVY